MSAPVVARLELDYDAQAAAAARTFVASTLWALGADRLLDDAALMTSELVTNAVLHARTELIVEVILTDEEVRLEVSDNNSRMPSRPDCPDDATSGRGLLLVEALATNWGAFGRGQGKVVWATLDF